MKLSTHEKMMDIFYNALLFLPFFVSAFGAVTFLCRWKKNLRPQKVWTVFLLLLSAWGFVWGALFNGVQDYYLYYKLDIIDLTVSLLFFPLIYLYFYSLTRPGAFTWRQYSWLLPGLFVGAGSALCYLLMGKEEAAWCIRVMVEKGADTGFVTGTLAWWESIFTIYLYLIVFFLQTVVVLVYATRSFIEYRTELTRLFSNLDEKSIDNSRAVLIGLCSLVALCLLSEFLWALFNEQYYLIRYLLMAVGGGLIYYMSYHVFHLRFTIESIPSEEAEDQPVEASAASSYTFHERVLPELNRLLNDEELFLNPNLSVNDLVLLVHTNRTYISQVINTEFGCSFYDLINTKRVEYAQELIRRNPTYTQEQIAQMSGFSYATTFSRIFKKHTGYTFREWQRTFL